MYLNKVFVYGTLKEGMGNDRPIYRNNRLSAEKATVQGTLFDLGSFPGLALKGETVVQGEVHTYPLEKMAELLVEMDRLEGFSTKAPEDRNFYNRRTVDVTLLDGKKVRAFLYEINIKTLRSEPPSITSGVWTPKRR